MNYFYVIMGDYPNGDTAYDLTLNSLDEVRKWHETHIIAHFHTVSKVSNKSYTRIYDVALGKVIVDKKGIDVFRKKAYKNVLRKER